MRLDPPRKRLEKSIPGLALYGIPAVLLAPPGAKNDGGGAFRNSSGCCNVQRIMSCNCASVMCCNCGGRNCRIICGFCVTICSMSCCTRGSSMAASMLLLLPNGDGDKLLLLLVAPGRRLGGNNALPLPFPNMEASILEESALGSIRDAIGSALLLLLLLLALRLLPHGLGMACPVAPAC